MVYQTILHVAPLSIDQNRCVPLGHANRGTKGAQRLVKTHATVEDTNWTIDGQTMIIQSCSKENSIDVLVNICGRQKAQSAPFLTNDRVLNGIETGNGFLLDVDILF